MRLFALASLLQASFAIVLPARALAEVQCLPDTANDPQKCTPARYSMIANQLASKRMLQQYCRDRNTLNAATNQARTQNPGATPDQLQAAAASALDDILAGKAGDIGSALPIQGVSPDLEAPYAMSLDTDCGILARDRSDQPTMLSEARAVNTCKEFNDAELSHERLHQERCNGPEPGRSQRKTLSGKAAEEVQGYQREIDALQAFEKAYWGLCSPRLSSMRDAHNALARGQSGASALGARQGGRRH
jgi:hypothetical protein